MFGFSSAASIFSHDVFRGGGGGGIGFRNFDLSIGFSLQAYLSSLAQYQAFFQYSQFFVQCFCYSAIALSGSELVHSVFSTS